MDWFLTNQGQIEAVALYDQHRCKYIVTSPVEQFGTLNNDLTRCRTSEIGPVGCLSINLLLCRAVLGGDPDIKLYSQKSSLSRYF